MDLYFSSSAATRLLVPHGADGRGRYGAIVPAADAQGGMYSAKQRRAAVRGGGDAPSHFGGWAWVTVRVAPGQCGDCRRAGRDPEADRGGNAGRLHLQELEDKRAISRKCSRCVCTFRIYTIKVQSVNTKVSRGKNSSYSSFLLAELFTMSWLAYS